MCCQYRYSTKKTKQHSYFCDLVQTEIRKNKLYNVKTCGSAQGSVAFLGALRWSLRSLRLSGSVDRCSKVLLESNSLALIAYTGFVVRYQVPLPRVLPMNFPAPSFTTSSKRRTPSTSFKTPFDAFK